MDRRVLLSVAVMGLAGCASGFKEPPPDTDYGVPPVGYEVAIKEHFEYRLKDPESARYKFGKPGRAYTNEGLMYGGAVTWKGYLVPVEINAKNSFGGYSGAKPYMVIFVGNEVLRHFEGTSHPLVHRLE